MKQKPVELTLSALLLQPFPFIEFALIQLKTSRNMKAIYSPQSYRNIPFDSPSRYQTHIHYRRASCSLCGDVLMRHFHQGKLSWFCHSCRQNGFDSSTILF